MKYIAAVLLAFCVAFGLTGCTEVDTEPKDLPERVVRIDPSNNALQVVRSRWRPGLLSGKITGLVRNNTTDMTYRGLMVHIVVLDKHNAIVDMTADRTEELKPGEIWRFSARLKPFLFSEGLHYEVTGFDFQP